MRIGQILENVSLLSKFNKHNSGQKDYPGNKRYVRDFYYPKRLIAIELLIKLSMQEW